MHESMRKELYWTFMANSVYATACDCPPCVQNLTHGKRQRQLRLFFPRGLLEYSDVEIRGSIRRIKHGNQVVVLMIYQYNKLTKAILTSKKILQQLAPFPSIERQISVS